MPQTSGRSHGETTRTEFIQRSLGRPATKIGKKENPRQGIAQRIEIHFRERNDDVLKKLQELHFSPVETSILSLGFIFPRTIVQIINEAFFALEDGVATKTDIDRAMKFGVNYPKGDKTW